MPEDGRALKAGDAGKAAAAAAAPLDCTTFGDPGGVIVDGGDVGVCTGVPTC